VTGGLVLILAQATDDTTDTVTEVLRARGVGFVRIDTADFPLSVELSAMPDRLDSPGWLCVDGREMPLASVCSVYRRHPAQFTFPSDMSGPEKRFATLESVAGLGGVLAGQRWRWIDSPAAVADASRKPLQLRTAASCGLRVPPSLVTNSGPRVRKFATEVGGNIIYKSLSTGVIIESDELRIIYTARVCVDDLDGRAIGMCCHLFQKWVPKVFDVRMTVVGANVFPVAVRTTSEQARTDWRSRYDELSYDVCAVPAPVRAGALKYLRSMNLTYGAFDFSVTADGEWWFLECNPSGQWGWIADETGLPIAEAIADELVVDA